VGGPALVAAAGAVCAYWSPAAAPFAPAVARAFGIRTTISAARGVLLSFDDGPHLRGTPAVLFELERLRAQAVFFVSGEQARRHGALLREVLDAGHEVGLHGYKHQTRRQLSRRSFAEDTRRALEAVSVATGAAPRLYRPPHGVFSITGLRYIRGLDLEPLLWSRWGRDWESGATVSSIARRATEGVSGGDVILLHDADHYGAEGCWRLTVAALAEICARIDTAGLQVAPAGAASETSTA
jgi:peptidoglycan/xylan/chitin deacetylase (PgdA/CDA1 family)